VNLTGNVLFSAEATACELPADAHLVFGDAQGGRHLAAVGVGDLRADVDFHAAVGQGHSDAAFRFHKQVVREWRKETVFNDNF